MRWVALKGYVADKKRRSLFGRGSPLLGGVSMSPDIEVALLSSNAILSEGLRHILGDHAIIAGPTAQTTEQISFAGESSGDRKRIIIVDAGNVDKDGNLYAVLRESHPEAAVLVLADHFDFESVINAFRLGVDAYLTKNISSEPLIETLRLTALGQKVLPSEMANYLSDRVSPMGLPMNLTEVNLSEREVQVLQQLIMGASNKVIGRRLGICEATVKVHVKAALRKLHVSNRTQAAIWAVQRGMTGTDGMESRAQLEDEIEDGTEDEEGTEDEDQALGLIPRGIEMPP
jgi:two-component system, NarL family, nitrate/nitrite response regulator NarL